MARSRLVILGLAIGFGILGGRADANAACEPPAPDSREAWLPTTPFPDYARPPAHPASDCAFYQAAWQTFLHVSQPDPTGAPAFLAYPGVSGLFEAGAETGAADGHGLSLSPGPTDSDGIVLGSGVRQAGMGGILIDRKGAPVYYAMHFNDRFADFVRSRGLATRQGILAADKSLAFDEAGLVELKSAWRVLDETDDQEAYFVQQARVPRLVRGEDGLRIDPTGATREVAVGLVALHVVFTMEGHPEFIWSTFEHVDRAKAPDIAPNAGVNPRDTPTDYVADGERSYAFYAAGTVAEASNLNGLPSDAQLAEAFDEGRQTFTAHGVLTTPVFREFPASKATTVQIDGESEELNRSVWGQFAALDPTGEDKRQNYMMVGATWLDRPERDFALDRAFANGPEENSDIGPVAGEDALSSVAMESFTQTVFQNCFSCHDTRAVYASAGGEIIDARNINVSHAFSHFLNGGR